jgi:hypothetical protein
MKRYEILVTIEEGSDEFWEGLDEPGVSEVLGLVRNELEPLFPDAEIKLVKFEDK